MINLRIDLHDGTHLETQVESFNAEDTSMKINDNTLFTIAVGDVVVSRNAIRAIYEVTT